MKKWLPSLLILAAMLIIMLIYYTYPIEKVTTTSIAPIPTIAPSHSTNRGEQAHRGPTPTVSPEYVPNIADSLQDHIDQVMNSLTLKQKIGQLLIVGIEDKGTTASKATQKLITEQGIGNIILFKRNIKNDVQLLALIQQLKELPAEQMPPLWISIDQEGGKVNRLPEQFPSAEQLALINDPVITKQVGEGIGTALSELSIDMNFAPVLDINSNPNNPVIGSRAFGSDASSVVVHSSAMLDGLKHYVITVGKHFPGHGDTNVDSHQSLPTIDKSWEELEQLELIPFRAAIEGGIDAIMMGHLFLPQIDHQYPASLSPIIIQNYLRDELNFNGVIITDDLIMGGISEGYDIGEAAILALQAGNTMLIVGHEPKLQQQVIQALYEAVEQNLLDEKIIDAAVELVLKLKLGDRN